MSERLTQRLQNLAQALAHGARDIQPIARKLAAQLGPRRAVAIVATTVGLGLITMKLAGLLVPQKETRADRGFRPLVEVIRAQERTLRHELKLPGTVTYLNKATVAARIPGRVRRIRAWQGQRVRKGTLLLELETFDLVIKLRQAQSALLAAEARYQLTRARHQTARRDVEKRMRSIERMEADIVGARANFQTARQNLANKRDLFRLGGVSRMDLKGAYTQYLSAMARYYQTRKDYQTGIVGFRNRDLRLAGLRSSGGGRTQEALTQLNTQVSAGEVRVARAGLQSSRLELANVRLMLKEARVRSPLSGVVAARNIEQGEQAKPGEPIFTIVQMSRLLVSVQAPEREVRHLRVGRKVQVRFDALDGHVQSGRIHRIAPVVDTKTRSAELRLLVENKDRRLAPGMFARCVLPVRTKHKAIALPRSALVDVSNGSRRRGAIFVVRGENVFKRQVTLGEVFGEETEITKGIKPGELVVRKGVHLLRDGSLVRVARAKPRKGGGPK